MKSKNWLSDLLEESSYQIYLEQQPQLIEIIRKGLSAGEPPKKIKQFVEQAAGNNHKLTSSLIGHMIDYVNKQIKN